VNKRVGGLVNTCHSERFRDEFDNQELSRSTCTSLRFNVTEQPAYTPTCVDHLQPVNGPLHRLRHGLEERDAEDAAGAEHERLEGDVVDGQRPVDNDVSPVERLDEPDAHDADVASGASTRLDEERTLTVHVNKVCTDASTTHTIE